MLRSNSSNAMWMMDIDMSDLELGMEFGGLFNDNEKDILSLPDEVESGIAKPKENQDEFFNKPQEDVLDLIVNEIQLEDPNAISDSQELTNQASFFIEPLTSDQVFLPSANQAQLLKAEEPRSFCSSPCSSSASLSPCPSNDDTQSLIEEMEEFLVTQEQQDSQEADAKEAERLLDALIKGEITMADDQVSNVTQMQTLDDGNIIIVVTNDDMSDDDTKSVSAASSPAQSDQASFVDSDSDWSPESPPTTAVTARKAAGRRPSSQVVQQGRVGKKRGPYNTKKRAGKVNVEDKKERKKLQNVVAARRYRDKKKSELSHVETVESELADRNQELKEKLAEMEGEVKTLKKLLVELGLVTIK